MSDQQGLIKRSSPLVKALGQSLKAGSLGDLIRLRQESNITLLLDCSGSMGDHLATGKTRMQGMRETVAQIQAEKQMKMIQFGWGPEPSFIETIPPDTGGTPLHLAIILAKNNGVGRAIVLSDGVPDDRTAALQAARDFGGRIDVIFIGNPGEVGEQFLKELAECTGGESFTGDLTIPKQLAGQILGLLGSGEADDEDED